MRLIYTLIIIVITLITIVIALVLISRFSLINNNASPFTYGSTIRIQSIATTDYLSPTCTFNKPISGVLTGPSSAVSASSSATDIANTQLWEIVVPPSGTTTANGGYVFRNVSDGKYMFFPYSNTSNRSETVPLLAVPTTSLDTSISNTGNTKGAVLSPASLYSDPRFVFQISRTPSVNLGIGLANDDVYIISHREVNGTVSQLVTIGNLNAASSTPDLSLGCSAPAEIDPIGQFVISTTSAACTRSSAACVQFVKENSAQRFVIEQRVFKIVLAVSQQ